MRIYRVHGTELPFTNKINTSACLGNRTSRPNCHCCGGSSGIRRGWRKLNKYSSSYSKWIVGKEHWTNVPSRGHKPKKFYK